MSTSRALFSDSPATNNRTIDILNAEIHNKLGQRETKLFLSIKAICIKPENRAYSKILEETIGLALDSMTRLSLLQLITPVYRELQRIDFINNRSNDSDACEFFTLVTKRYPIFPDLKSLHAGTLLALSHQGDKKERRIAAFKLMHGALTDKVLINASKNKDTLAFINTCKIHFEQRLLQVAKQESIQILIQSMLERIWQEVASIENNQTPSQQWQQSQHTFSNDVSTWYNPDIGIKNQQQQKLFALFDAAFNIMNAHLKVEEISERKLSTWIEQFSTAEVIALSFEMHPWRIIYGCNVENIKRSLPKEDAQQNKRISKQNICDICQNNYIHAYNVIKAQQKTRAKQPIDALVTELFFSSLDKPLQQRAIEAWLNFHFGPIAYHPPPNKVTRSYLQQRKNAIQTLEWFYIKHFEEKIADYSDLCQLVSVSPFTEEEIAESRAQGLRDASELPEMQLLQMHLRYLLLFKAIIIRDLKSMMMLKNIFLEYFSWQQSRDESVLINWLEYGFVFQSSEHEAIFTEMIALLIPYLSNDYHNYTENSQHIMAHLFSYGSRFKFDDSVLASFAQKCMDLADPCCRDVRREYALQVRNSPSSTSLNFFGDLFYKAKGLSSPKKPLRRNTISEALVQRIFDYLMNPQTTQRTASFIPHTHDLSQTKRETRLFQSHDTCSSSLADRFCENEATPPPYHHPSLSRESAASADTGRSSDVSTSSPPRLTSQDRLSYASPPPKYRITAKEPQTLNRYYFSNMTRIERRAISPINSGEKRRQSQGAAKQQAPGFPDFR